MENEKNVNVYESVAIATEKLSEQGAKDLFAKYENYFNKYMELTKSNFIGLKKLAYEVRKNKSGYFFDYYFKAKKDDIPELERIYKQDDNILKFIVIKTEF